MADTVDATLAVQAPSDTGLGDTNTVRSLGERAADLKESLGEKAAHFRSTAGDKAKDLASQGKDRATDTLEKVAKLVEEQASNMEDRLGTSASDYMRKAASAVNGFASGMRDKQIDDLIEDARDMVRKNPAIAIGAAVAVGFVVARLVKSGLNSEA